MFYPDDPSQCRAQAKAYTTLAASAAGAAAGQNWIGGVVPHAGWICSAALAGQTIATLGSGGAGVDLVVVFGAIHTPIATQFAMLDSFAKWNVPGDSCEVQDEVRHRLLADAAPGSFAVDDRFHYREHSVEVELPLIRSVWPDAAILPIEVPAVDTAVRIGQATAKLIAQSRQATPGAGRVVFLASSDLTHYGLNYGFMPAGVGIIGMQWAKQNDRPLIEKILKLQAEAIVPEVRAHLNACGAGAIAAMLAACRELGASRAALLRHATSYETLAHVAPQSPDNAVGYAAIVVG
jgi:AmmeMemoRadiSam system protein B